MKYDISFTDDKWIVVHLDKLMHRIQRNIGLDCFFFAKIFMLIAFFNSLTWNFLRVPLIHLLRVRDPEATIILRAHTNSIFPESISIFGLILFVIIPLVSSGLRVFIDDVSINTIEKDVKKKVGSGAMNNRIFAKRWSYIYVVATLYTFIIDTIFEPSNIVFNLVDNFLNSPMNYYYISIALCACNPLPPRKSRLRSWWEKKREMISRQESDDLIPQPA